MSSAGRGGPRVAADNYPTPAWCTRRILEALELRDFTYRASGPIVIEPCAGDGAIANVMEGWALPGGSPEEPIVFPRVYRYDIRNILGVTPFDATQRMELAQPFDLLITNPPFNLAHEIIQAQRDTARLCVYLLRSSFIAGERAEAYRHDMPDEYRLPERPEFVRSMKCKTRLPDGRRIDGCGWSEKIPMCEAPFAACPCCGSTELQSSTTDSTPYSWFVWGHERRSWGRSIILPSTPLEERKAT